MLNIKYAALVVSGAIVAACGGGGNDAPAAPTYLAGTYNATYTKTQDNCFIGGAYNGVAHVVTLNGSDVRVQVNTLTLNGSAKSDGGLFVTYESRDTNATARATLIYALPAGQTAPGNGTFNSELLIQGIDNASGFTCSLRYNGTVTKVG